jgi:hypothetical protein
LQTLKDRAVLTIDRQQTNAFLFCRADKKLACHNQRLFIRQRNFFSRKYAVERRH